MLDKGHCCCYGQKGGILQKDPHFQTPTKTLKSVSSDTIIQIGLCYNNIAKMIIDIKQSAL